MAHSVDLAVGSVYDRAFALLDALEAATRNHCHCRRCRTLTDTIGVVLRRELRHLSPGHDPDIPEPPR